MRRHASVLPGLRVSLAVTIVALALIVVLPLAGLLAKASLVPWARVAALASDARVLAAFRISFGMAALAALVNVPIGFLLAWTLTRERFVGRRLLDAMIDLPFALPTAVAGVALTTLYVEQGWIGAVLAEFGINVAFTPAGIFVALQFVGLPFVVRSLQPVLLALPADSEEAAMTLGAPWWQVFRRVIVPPLMPAALIGAGMAFARGVGEYGSVIFIAGNRPAISEIVPLLIVSKLEQFDYPGAALLGTVMLVLSLLMLLALGRVTRAAPGMAHG